MILSDLLRGVADERDERDVMARAIAS